MDLFEELREIGVDVDDGIDRVMGNAGLYQRMLVKLCEMLKNLPAESAFDEDDISALIEKIHAVKGSTGNLSVTPLYIAYMEILTLLRENKPKRAKAVFEDILPVQNKIIACIEKCMQ